MQAASYNVSKDQSVQQFSSEQYDTAKTNLAFCFGSKSMVKSAETLAQIQSLFPEADIILGSSSGEIYQSKVYDESMSVLAMSFDKTTHKSVVLNNNDYKNEYELGKDLFAQLEAPDLSYIHLLSDGVAIHKGELMRGINEKCAVEITGGLAGDADMFQETLVGLNNLPQNSNVVGVGFYGNHIKVAYGSFGGWEEFGLSRTITKSDYNILYEVDGKNILDLYKKYLGPYADELSVSAIRFPISMENSETGEKIVRTVLGINEKDKSIRFAGDVPEGCIIRLMKSSTDDIIEGAKNAAKMAVNNKEFDQPKAALLVSCVGRKIVLDKRVNEEIEEMQEVLGENIPMAGYYSYGEVSPISKGGKSKLHNQTMTLTLFDEIS